MSRWSAPSDRDYEAEYDGGSNVIARTCAECGETTYRSPDEPYEVRPVCRECAERSHAQPDPKARTA